MSIPASHEVLTFLADPNPQVRQLAMSNVVGFTAKESPERRLLLDKLTDHEGKPLRIWDGSELNVVEQIKSLCRDQPVRHTTDAAHYA